MIHELLLALSGIPGDVFVADDETGCYRIPDEIDFLHSSERSLLEAVAKLGYVYCRIRAVLESWSSSGSAAPARADARVPKDRRLQSADAGAERELPSAYRTALANAIEAEVLEGYRGLIVENEKLLLSATAPDDEEVLTSIAMVSHTFSKYTITLPYVYDVVSEVRAAGIDMHGTRLLSFLHSRSHVGIPQVRDMMRVLLRRCEDVLLKQLSSWMVHGTNFDPHSDWFIKGQDEEVAGRGVGANTRRRDKSKWHTEFTLEPAMVPSYVSAETAEAILFVGRAMNTMRTSGSNDAELESSIQSRIADLEAGDAPLSSIQFDAAVASIRKDVSVKIWDVVMRVGELEAIMNLFRTVFLLGNGQLFTAFIDGTNEVLAKAHARKSAVREQDIIQLWGVVARALLSTDDNLVESFHFRVLDRAQNPEHLPFDDFLFAVPLRFCYDLKWPMDLIFTDREMQSYSVVFTFLLAVKQTQMQLQHVFRLIGRQTADADIDAGVRRTMQSTRTSMQFFLDSLLHYTQYDILEPAFEQLLHVVRSQKEFENIQKHHRAFLTTVMTGCFVDAEMYKGVGKTVRETLELCRKFCGIAERHARGSPESVEAAIGELDEAFWLKMSSIFESFSSLSSTLRQNQCLDQLVLRLDFNGFLR
ncbi:gamma-tubulin complex component protein [Hyaloraphidium curvatum]|nr:gamma-tubulin complex component protein [Hyaloraphidium curvatum]